MKLDDTSTKNVAAETEDSQIERARAIKKLKSLEAGLQTLIALAEASTQIDRHSSNRLWL